jgi:hypothetical protein
MADTFIVDKYLQLHPLHASGCGAIEHDVYELVLGVSPLMRHLNVNTSAGGAMGSVENDMLDAVEFPSSTVSNVNTSSSLLASLAAGAGLVQVWYK